MSSSKRLPNCGNSNDYNRQLIRELRALLREIHEMLERLEEVPADDFVRWWKSLSPEERIRLRSFARFNVNPFVR